MLRNLGSEGFAKDRFPPKRGRWEAPLFGAPPGKSDPRRGALDRFQPIARATIRRRPPGFFRPADSLGRLGLPERNPLIRRLRNSSRLRPVSVSFRSCGGGATGGPPLSRQPMASNRSPASSPSFHSSATRPSGLLSAPTSPSLSRAHEKPAQGSAPPGRQYPLGDLQQPGWLRLGCGKARVLASRVQRGWRFLQTCRR